MDAKALQVDLERLGLAPSQAKPDMEVGDKRKVGDKGPAHKITG